MKLVIESVEALRILKDNFFDDDNYVVYSCKHFKGYSSLEIPAGWYNSLITEMLVTDMQFSMRVKKRDWDRVVYSPLFEEGRVDLGDFNTFVICKKVEVEVDDENELAGIILFEKQLKGTI